MAQNTKQNGFDLNLLSAHISDLFTHFLLNNLSPLELTVNRETCLATVTAASLTFNSRKTEVSNYRRIAQAERSL